MHYGTFVIIGPQGDPDALVAGVLAPFDEMLAVTPYREYPSRRRLRSGPAYQTSGAVVPRAVAHLDPE